MKLVRDSENPLLAPSDRWWDCKYVFNPAVVEYRGRVHMVYRAHGWDGFGRFGYAVSDDGIRFAREPEPVLEGAIDDPMARLGIEDPRGTVIDDWVYLVYTSASVYGTCFPHPPVHVDNEPPWRTRVCIARTQDFHHWETFGVVVPEYDSKNGVLFPGKVNGRYAMLHRVRPDIWLAFSDDLRTWTDHRVVMGPRVGWWDSRRIGAGPPPVRVEKGWLLFYHGIAEDGTYRTGAALLDAQNPAKVLARLDDWLLQPEKEFEEQGWVANVVFPTGLVERDGVFRLYYGGADRVICGATIARAEVEAALYEKMGAVG